jgi:choline dehydrogenase
MWDHVLFLVTHKINIGTTSILEDPVQAHIASQQYNLNKTGILTTNNADYLGWEKIPAKYYSNLTATAKADLAIFPADWPDLEHVVLSFNPGTYLAANITYGTLEPALITPLPRGNVSLNSSSMSSAPLINVGWLSNPTDLETGVVAIKRAREFWASSIMQGIVTGEEVLPGKNVSSDAQIKQWLKKNVQTVYHASCTCKMGMVDDLMAVTDSRARVIGVKGLRVVDASTFPMLPPGHPRSTICESSLGNLVWG